MEGPFSRLTTVVFNGIRGRPPKPSLTREFTRSSSTSAFISGGANANLARKCLSALAFMSSKGAVAPGHELPVTAPGSIMSTSDDPNAAPEGTTQSAGLLRTILAGPGHTLGDVFANLELAPQVERVVRHAKRDLLGARVTLAPGEGEGYWELTRIRHDFYVVVWNFVYKNPRFELVPGDGLIQFNFRVTGDLTLAVSRAQPLRFNRPSLLVWAQSP